MAEVRSYKCDICGEVYHVEEGIKEFMNIAYARGTDENVYIEAKFDHICPDCRNTIRKCISNPKIIDELHENIDELLEKKHKLEDCLKKIRVQYNFGDFTGFAFGGWNYVEKYEELANACVEEYADLKKSHMIWKRVAFAAIGLVVGVIGVLILRVVA